ncbi:triose-phosphate isomerase [Patescibacteria group bacterium]|nr:triose-phosphate isomerase [Patescibacteria group bacterium]
MKKLIVANWKLNPESAKAAESLARLEDRSGVVICPPTIYLAPLKKVLKRAKLGAQDAFWIEEGPYTGAVSPSQLVDLGVKYVIIGHSERRYLLQESDEVINQKVETALKAGLQVILCIGEDLESHEKGSDQTRLFIVDQLGRALKNVKSKYFKNIVIAYEPVWAISTSNSGLEDAPDESKKIISLIKTFLKKRYLMHNPRVMYGGSVNAENFDEYLADDLIDGVLVGSASLNPREFNKIQT